MGLVGDIPHIARPLKSFDNDRRKKFLQLAMLLLQTEDNASTQRTVQYMIALSNPNAPAEPVPALPWLSVRCDSEFDALVSLDPGQSLIGKVIPQMQFSARMQRRR